jgi:hypothetical protein
MNMAYLALVVRSGPLHGTTRQGAWPTGTAAGARGRHRQLLRLHAPDLPTDCRPKSPTGSSRSRIEWPYERPQISPACILWTLQQ